MDSSSPTSPEPVKKLKMDGWAYFSIAVLLLTAAFLSTVFAVGAFFALHRFRSGHVATTPSVIMNRPTYLAGPAIEMALPAGSNLSSATTDSEGGNWWYQAADTSHLHVLIAASKLSGGQSSISNSYFQRVIQIVERSGGDQITAMSAIHEVEVGSYTGQRATYDVRTSGGQTKHAVALLVRRESDDLLVILYGDGTMRARVDLTAQKMFNSLNPRPTPQQYDVHSAVASPQAGTLES